MASTHPRIEELPDDFDESMDLNAPPPKPTTTPPAAGPELPVPGNEERMKESAKDAPKPDLPPAMAAVDSHTTDELADILNKTPLFMTDISKAGDESEFFFLLLGFRRRSAGGSYMKTEGRC